MAERLRVVIGSGGSRHNQGWLHTEASELNLLNEEEWANRFKKSGGFIYRSRRFDHRNTEGRLGFVSLIVDAVKV
ncbi:hypothetical protein MKY96_13470 [Paenibacillus sp. FSL R7-0302]|uniref:hypothetical protein n=1 Tax=Paenibacillus sp. FSL R7-0302 TaxID=2921681 RepID=UPI0030F85CF3